MIVKNPVPVTENDVRSMAKLVKRGIRHIYLHWTEDHYDRLHDEYHFCVDPYGRVFANCNSLKDFKAHTWLRNYDSIGIALCCGAGAKYRLPEKGYPRNAKGAVMGSGCKGKEYAFVDFGLEPPTYNQIEQMAKLVAVLCDELHLPIDKETVQTHCEVAFKDCYGPGDGDPDTHWDLWFLPDVFKTGGRLTNGGDLLRCKAQYYRQLMEYDRVAV